MRLFRTEPSANYVSPSEVAIKNAAKRVGLKTYSPTLVADIANVASGGRVKTSHEYREHLENSVVTRKDQHGYWRSRLIGQGGKSEMYSTSYEDLSRETEIKHAVKVNESICQFLREIDIDKTPGSTPLEKSVSLLKTLSSAGGYDTTDDVCGEDALPIFQEGRGDKEADKLNDIHEYIETLDDGERELMQTDDDDKIGGDGDGDDSELEKTRLAEDMIAGRRHWIEVSRNLSSLTRFRLGRKGRPKKDIEGDDVLNRQIAGLDEIGRIPAVEYALPEAYRLYRILTHATPVRERVSREGKKQLIYMLIDCSYSMRGSRMHKSGGVLLNRLKAVVSGEAELYFRFFDDNLKKEYSARTPEQAKACIETFRQETFQGNSTWIVKALEQTIKRIGELLASNELETNPELVIVSDGEDNVSELSERMFRDAGIRLHAFLVGGVNKELTRMARATGGVGVDSL